MDGPSTVTLAARSCEKSASGPDEGGDNELGVEFRELTDAVLLSEGAKGLAARGPWAEDGGGGARPFPLPRIRPPPSLRADMVAAVLSLTRRQCEERQAPAGLLLLCAGCCLSD